MILFFDTETTGKLDFKSPPSDKHQPDLVQLAACLTDDAADRIFGQISMIVQPPEAPVMRAGIQVPWLSEEVAKIHGIDDELARAVGVPRRIALSAFSMFCKQAEKLIAHNMDFDNPVMETAYHREGVRHRMDCMELVCTMKMATPVLKLPKPPGKWKPKPGDLYKWPTLTECHQHFFGEGFDGAHNALNDVFAMIRVYRELIKVAR
jgi:DNA polymerase III epsilon subunit-like protein